MYEVSSPQIHKGVQAEEPQLNTITFTLNIITITQLSQLFVYILNNLYFIENQMPFCLKHAYAAI